MTTISKGQLKAKMLGIFRDLERTGGELIVTDRGRAVLKIVPVQPGRADVTKVFAGVRGKVVYHRDPLEPTTPEWTEI